MISKFFIERPVLANVIAILMVVIGAMALYGLPVAQYPVVVPPIRSSSSVCREFVRNFESKAAREGKFLLVPLCFRSSFRGCCHVRRTSEAGH